MPNGGAPHKPGTSEAGPMLAHELGGDLQCARCRYNLKGLSIRAVCPECGTPIRATLLAVVDPMADELRPVYAPGLTAWGMVVWGSTPIVAALLVWSLRLMGPGWGRLGPLTPEVGVPLVAVASGIGALVLVRPHAGPYRRSILAGLGVLGYVPLVWLLWDLHVTQDASGPARYGSEAWHDLRRLATRMACEIVLALVIFLLRPNARELAARSLLMRAGRIDRQTMIALVCALGVSLVGDGLRWIGWTIHGGAGQLIDQSGQILILVSSVLLTIGFVGIAVDCWRLFPVILERPLSLTGVLTGRKPPSHS